MTQPGRLVESLRPRRVLLLAIFDGLAWMLGLAAFSVIGLAATEADLRWTGVVALGGVACALQLALGWAVRLHHGRAIIGTVEDLLLVASVTGTVGLLLSSGRVAATGSLGAAAVPLAATFLAVVVAACGRVAWRRVRQLGSERGPCASSAPVLVLGAGEGGRQLVDSMFRDVRRSWRPVGLLDDDPLKRHRRFHGVPVMGSRRDLAHVVERTGCRTLLVAIPSASADLGLDVKVVPGVADLLDGTVGVGDIRDLDVADLLGRRQIDTDVGSIASYLTGARVLVTGAGGSIGSELCRQIARFAPAELMMLDRDESALHAVQLSIYGAASLDSPDVVLADIRDAERVREVFTTRRPQVVFHAAALKHLTMLEQYPAEAVKSNVWGTLTVLQAARAAGVRTFVNISTDKAANPCSVLGYSKRLAERLTAEIARVGEGTYLSVRFGNVLGSRGSVLTTFAAQIAAGGPITVTDPDVTRYFMTVQEAVQLVIQAGAIGGDGDALVLDMGQPVRIDDVARRLAADAPRPIGIAYTGLHPGEKLHEELFGDSELDRRPTHPLISHVAVPPIRPEVALGLDVRARQADLVTRMRELCAVPALLSSPAPVGAIPVGTAGSVGRAEEAA
jgi:FlaA1/EpsC-like NDP-sugar epimerase